MLSTAAMVKGSKAFMIFARPLMASELSQKFLHHFKNLFVAAVFASLLITTHHECSIFTLFSAPSAARLRRRR